MIRSKADFKRYIAADKTALNVAAYETSANKVLELICGSAWSFQKILRKMEYYLNCKRHRKFNPYFYLLCIQFRRAQIKYGFQIEPNCFGPGLSIAHTGAIIVSSAARIGANCRIHPGVVIGTSAGHLRRVPSIGDNVFIGPNAVIVGDIKIADGVAVGANSYVDKSFTEPYITVAGCPAKKIKQGGTTLFHLGEQLDSSFENEGYVANSR